MHKPGFFIDSGTTFSGKSLHVLDPWRIQQIN